MKSISIPKGNLPNEDRMVIHENLYAVADGAGGTGILCGEWAGYLLEHLPLQPIKSYAELVAWFESIAEGFVEQYEPLMAQDNYQLRKFYEEGSACTLACVWQGEEEFYWLTYGDAHVFKIIGDNFESHPFSSREELSGGTYLLNWSRMPEEAGLCSGSFGVEDGSTLLLATDELAKHIFYLKENAIDFNQALLLLEEATASEEQFRKYILSQPDIGEDDYTLIIMHL